VQGFGGARRLDDVDMTTEVRTEIVPGGAGHDDPTAEFVAWYQTESGRVRTVLAGVCGDTALAEEATAEAFARAFARWSSVRAKDSPTAWVYRVALNEVRSRLRRRRNERRYVARQAVTPVPPPAEPRDDLWAALRELSPQARTAVVLRYVADLTEPQVAAAMGVSTGTVGSLLSRSRRRLAELLGPETEGESHR
jgi:RNA polymerase sigma factor (sigma-70 family)